ncbi:MAG: epimerase [Archangium sp.]
MRVLIIGGNRFLGVELTAQLLARGDDVALLNRGTLIDPFGARVRRFTADRGTDAFDKILSREDGFDAVVDFALFDGEHARRTTRVLAGKVKHYVAISTGQVYLVRTPRPASFVKESDYDGAVMSAPPSEAERDDWKYGIEKRDAEDGLRASDLPFTVFRIPMVHGPRDHKQRLERVFWKLVDRKPIVLRDASASVRHVFSGAITRTLTNVITRPPTRRAWNLAWDEKLTAAQFIERAAAQLGVTPNIEIDPSANTDACFLNSRWMSALDPSDARNHLGFAHEAMDRWLPGIFSSWLARL